MKQDKWTQQLHDKLADYQTPAPEGLWDDIESALASEGAGVQGDLQSPMPAQGSRQARFVTLRRWAAAAAVAAIIAGGGLVLYNSGPDYSAMEEKYAENMMEEQPDDGAFATEQPDDGAFAMEQQDGLKGQQAVALTGHSPETKSRGADAQVTLSGRTAQDTQDVKDATETASEYAAATETASENAPATETAPRDIPSAGSKYQPLHQTNPVKRKKSPRPSLNLYAMNSLGAKDNSNAVFMADALAQYYTKTFDEANLPAARRQAPIYLSGYEERQHHHQPVAFGLTFDYPLTTRLSLTSGVVYTRLRSDFTQVIRSQHISQEQTLHYIGVPLGLSYRLYQLGAFSAYAAAGVQADWNIAARQNTEGVERHIDRDRMQWSATASLGLQYSLPLGGTGLALYAEPGISHYFDNGSPIQNFFKDKPTSMKLQVGLRFRP